MNICNKFLILNSLLTNLYLFQINNFLLCCDKWIHIDFLHSRCSIIDLDLHTSSLTETTSRGGVSPGGMTFDQVSNLLSLCQSQLEATRDQTLLPNGILMTTLTHPSRI